MKDLQWKNIYTLVLLSVLTMWFHVDKRKRILKLMESYFSHGHQLVSLIQKWAKSQRSLRALERIRKIPVKNKQEYLESIQKAIPIIEKMIAEDAAITHLLIEMRRKGLVTFKGEQSDKAEEIFWILHEMSEAGKGIEENIIELEEMLGRKGLKKTNAYRYFRIYRENILKLLTSENQESQELTTALEEMESYEEFVFKIKEGRFKVELRKDYQGEYIILIFDHDFFVGKITLFSYSKERIVMDSARMYIGGRNYFGKAMLLILKRKKTEILDSSENISAAAHGAYRRFNKIPGISVKWIEDHYEIRLA